MKGSWEIRAWCCLFSCCVRSNKYVVIVKVSELDVVLPAIWNPCSFLDGGTVRPHTQSSTRVCDVSHKPHQYTHCSVFTLPRHFTSIQTLAHNSVSDAGAPCTLKTFRDRAWAHSCSVSFLVHPKELQWDWVQDSWTWSVSTSPSLDPRGQMSAVEEKNVVIKHRFHFAFLTRMHDSQQGGGCLLITVSPVAHQRIPSRGPGFSSAWGRWVKKDVGPLKKILIVHCRQQISHKHSQLPPTVPQVLKLSWMSVCVCVCLVFSVFALVCISWNRIKRR